MVPIHTHPGGEGIRASPSILRFPQDLMPPDSVPTSCSMTPGEGGGHLSFQSTLSLRMGHVGQREAMILLTLPLQRKVILLIFLTGARHCCQPWLLWGPVTGGRESSWDWTTVLLSLAMRGTTGGKDLLGSDLAGGVIVGADHANDVAIMVASLSVNIVYGDPCAHI